MSENHLIYLNSDLKKQNLEKKKEDKQIDVLEIEFQDKFEEQKKTYKEKMKDKKIQKIIDFHGQQKAKQAAILARESSYAKFSQYLPR